MDLGEYSGTSTPSEREKPENRPNQAAGCQHDYQEYGNCRVVSGGPSGYLWGNDPWNDDGPFIHHGTG